MATTFLSSFLKESDSVLDYCCTSCEEDSSCIVAEFFCEKCEKFYCEKCIAPHKQLFRTHVTYGRANVEKWPVSKAITDILEKCENHVNKGLKLFSEDHHQLCCSTCVLLNHRQCSKVNLIAESAKTCDSEDFNQLLSSMKSNLKELNKLQNSRQNTILSLQESYAEQLHAIRDIYKKLKSSLKDLEEKTIKALDDLMDKLKSALTTDVDHCTRLKDKLMRLSEAVQDLGDKEKQDLAFIGRIKCMEMIQQSETYMNDNNCTIEHVIKLVPNASIEQFLTKQSTLGVLIHPNTAIFVKGKTEYDVSIFDDSSNPCDIECIVQVSNGHFVVGDCKHNSIKLLDQHFKVKSHCAVSDGPRDMCQITSSEVAVGFYTGEVQFISLNKERLAKDRAMQLQHKCIGIAFHLAKLYITSGTALYQYTLSGSEGIMLHEDTPGSNTVTKCAVSPTGDMIFVTNNEKHKLLTLAKYGTLLSSFGDPELQGTWGVHVTPVGQVLVCGYSSKNILQLDSESKKKLATLVTEKDGLEGPPQTVILNSISNYMIVGQFDKDNLLVFGVKYSQ
ncbi:uncharacterized protein LOC127832373 isoform X2 [Dreissena polymorpha]|uniref:uncharacterized protein LOC127832373 isoform X2 n=1 Tax=Dreissena polymorpha TaxID=45954 RepID=UPI00226432D3|nr:uncharacterized protein LOC127832373 isoform X2 [Dreissena polymorpha]